MCSILNKYEGINKKNTSWVDFLLNFPAPKNPYQIGHQIKTLLYVFIFYNHKFEKYPTGGGFLKDFYGYDSVIFLKGYIILSFP